MWVVGIGASAGGVEALREVLPTLPDGDVCYVVAQHMSMAHPSLLFQVLNRETELDVIQLDDGMQLKPGVVYIPPPDRDVTVKEDRLVLIHAEPRISPQPSIDKLFRSIAENYHKASIGIILSGTGHDGSVGIASIAANGGRTIAQDSNSCRYSDMPLNAINTGCIQFVLAPHDIGPTVAMVLEGKEPKAPPGRFNNNEEMTALAIECRRVTGWDLSSYKDGTLHRQLAKRLNAIGKKNLEEYLNYVRDEPTELAQLRDSMLINVTEFLRDKTSFDALTSALRTLIRDKPDGEPIRVWIVGCASGEEAYSVAILLSEIVLEKGCEHPIKMFATDISDAAMEAARRGIYPIKSLRDVPKKWVERYFTISGDNAQVDKRLRDMLVIARQDITHDPPLVRMDLVCCRNLLIYLTPEVQERVIANLDVSLLTRGLIFLGRSESVPADSPLFTTVDARSRIFQRRPGSAASLQVRAPLFAAPVSLPPMPRSPMLERDQLKDTVRDKLLSQYCPPSILTDQEGTPLHMIGHVARYLSMPEGDMDITITNMIHPDLKAELRSTISRVTRDGAACTGIVVSFKPSDDVAVERLRLQVSRVSLVDVSSFYLLISFISLGINTSENRITEPVNNESTEGLVSDTTGITAHSEIQIRYEEIQGELTATREHLRAVIEELESSNEELQAMNEELQASSEELQATNEELETTNEELQATNEELTTVNETLELRTTELSAANVILSNIQESVATAIILVDCNQQVERYSPMAVKVFGLLPSDIGTKISRLPSQLDVLDLENTIQIVIQTGNGVVKEVSSSTNTYLMQIQPYCEAQTITGAVIALADITELAEARQALEAQSQQFQALADAVPSVVYQRNVQTGDWNYFTPSFERLFGVTPDLSKRGSLVLDPFIHPEDRGRVIDFHASNDSGQIDFKIVRPDGQVRVLRDMFKTNAHSGQQFHVGAFVDISDLATATQSAENKERRCQTMFNLVNVPLAILNISGVITHANQAMHALLGTSSNSILGHPLSDFMSPESKQVFESSLKTVARDAPTSIDLETAFIDTNSQVKIRHQLIRSHAGGDGENFAIEIFTVLSSDDQKGTNPQGLSYSLDQLTRQGKAAYAMLSSELKIIDANSAFCNLVNTQIPDAVNSSYLQYILDDDLDLAQSQLQSILSENSRGFSCTYRLRGSITPIWVNVVANRTTDCDQCPIFVSLHDVTSDKEREASIGFAAQKDPLTYCLNRSSGLDRAEYALKCAQRDQRGLAAIIIDVDHFKEINEEFGHVIGDDLLRLIGVQLNAEDLQIDFVSRLGSDEFLVVLTATELELNEDASRFAETLQRKIQLLTKELNIIPSISKLGNRFHDEIRNSFANVSTIQNLSISTSIGIAVNEDNSKGGFHELIRCAELALIRAKGQGSGHISFYSEVLEKAVQKGRENRREIHAAVQEGQFVPYLMPITDSLDLQLKGCEMLMRWDHPERGIIMPDEFIPILTETKLLDKALLNCLELSLKSLNSLIKKTNGFYISINIEPDQLLSKEFTDKLLAIGQGFPGNLILELTEAGSFSAEKHGPILKSLKESNFKLSLDDFGTGYSEVKSILDFQFDEIKIDQIFINKMTKNGSESTSTTADKLLKSMSDLIHSVGAQVVIEGISSNDDLNHARAAHADKIQGFLISEALAAGEFQSWADSYKPGHLQL